MTEFGDSSLNFLLRFWIDDPQQGLTNIRGKVLLALWDTFKETRCRDPVPATRNHNQASVPPPVVETIPAPVA